MWSRLKKWMPQYILDVPGVKQHGQPAEREQPLPAVSVAQMRSHTRAVSMEPFTHFLQAEWHTPCWSCCLSLAISAPRKHEPWGANDWFLCWRLVTRKQKLGPCPDLPLFESQCQQVLCSGEQTSNNQLLPISGTGNLKLGLKFHNCIHLQWPHSLLSDVSRNVYSNLLIFLKSIMLLVCILSKA